MTLVFAKERSLKGIREALEARRTAAYADGCVYGKAEWLEPLLKACLEITDIKYSEKKVTVNVRNISTIPITLTKAPGGEDLTYPRLLYINEGEDLSIAINGKDSRNPIGQNEFDVNFYIANWYTDVDKPLFVSWHFVMPEKYRQ